MTPIRSAAFIAATRPRFPFFSHRTMAEVAETEALARKLLADGLAPYEMRRLRELLQRKVRTE